MKNLIFLFALLAILFGCSADYDTFGESDYNNLEDLSFEEQNGSASIYSGEHRIKITLSEPDSGTSTWDSVTLEYVNLSHMASIHLVSSKFESFPSDSLALDSLSREVSYSGEALQPGDKIRIPESLVVYLMVVSESGAPNIWKVEFVIPGKITSGSSKKGSSSSSESSSDGKSSSSAKSSSSSSDDKSDNETASSSSKGDEGGSSGNLVEESSSSESSGDEEAPAITALEIEGVKAVLQDSHFHVDSIPFRSDLTSLDVTLLEFSEDGVTCDIEEGSSYDFSESRTISVTGKSGAKRAYTVKAGYQLPGSDFDSWDDDDPQPDSVWNNANTILTTTTKYTSGSMIGAKMVTDETMGKVASGSLYTADFNPNGVSLLSMASSSTWPDGNELINFGRKFEGRPEFVEFTFSYEGKGDSCDLYVLLENRTGDENINRSSGDVNTLVASAWYRSTTGDNTDRENPDVISVSDADENGMRTVRLKFTYGEPLAGSPIENSSVFAEGLQSSKNTAIDNSLVKGDGSDAVTHVRVVMASSAAGNFYEGVKGATLIVDAMRLIY